jgi:hypothetical protein
MSHYIYYSIAVFIIGFIVLTFTLRPLVVFFKAKSLKKDILSKSTFKELYKGKYKDKTFNITGNYTKTIKNFEEGLRVFLDSKGLDKDLLLTSCYDLIVLHNIPLKEIIKSERHLESKLTLDDLRIYLNDMTTPDVNEIVGTYLFAKSCK